MAGSTKLMTAGGGGVSIQPASSIASDVTVNVPSVDGTLLIPGQASAITAGTAVASTSGTSIDFTNIPSWVKRITVMFQGVSTSGTSGLLIQIGAGSVDTSSYQSGLGSINTSTAATASSSAGFIVGGASASNQAIGHYVLTNSSGSTWVGSGVIYLSSSQVHYAAGARTLSGTLDRVRLTTVGGTDTFDAGSINILYE